MHFLSFSTCPNLIFSCPKADFTCPKTIPTCPEKLTKTLNLTNMSEIQLQAKIFQHYWNQYPQTRGLIFHVPNGGKRSKIESTQLKASGVVAGIPDLLILSKGRSYGMELKTEVGRLRPEQVKIHAIWISDGTPVFLCRNFDEAKQIIDTIFGF